MIFFIGFFDQFVTIRKIFIKETEMKKSLLAMAIFALASAAFAEDIVHYSDTTYGPSDTVVHYDTNRHQEKSGMDKTNIPNSDIYSQTEKR